MAGDVTDGGEVAADGRHVCESGVAEVVGAEVLGLVPRALPLIQTFPQGKPSSIVLVPYDR